MFQSPSEPSCQTDIAAPKRPASPASRSRKTLACLGPSTRIATIDGECRAKDLSVDDQLLTRDNGYQPLRWLGRYTPALHGQGTQSAQGVCVVAGALAPGVPTRDLVMSTHQRILLTPHNLCPPGGPFEAFLRARYLVRINETLAYRVSVPKEAVLILMDRHELILANGLWTETLQPNAEAIETLPPDQRQQVETLFPDLRKPGHGKAFPAARAALPAICVHRVMFHKDR